MADENNVIFDETSLLRRLQGHHEIARAAVGIFLKEVPQMFSDLAASLESGILKEVENSAHRLKGAAANVSAEQVRELAWEIEKSAKAGDLKTISGRLDGLSSAVDHLTENLKSWMGNDG